MTARRTGTELPKL